MTIQLPTLPQATTTTYNLASNALDQQPQLGGPTQRIARMGDRFTLTFKCRSLFYAQASAVVSALIQGLSAKVRAYIPQPGFNTSGSGSVTFANAAASTGTVVAMTGFTPGYTVLPGQFFNVGTNGVQYLYMTTGTLQAANANGAATISFQPMLKAQPNSGDAINFVNPVIEGFLGGNQQSWDLSLVQTSGITFSIKEAQ